jgi:hypothetical protein
MAFLEALPPAYLACFILHLSDVTRTPDHCNKAGWMSGYMKGDLLLAVGLWMGGW